MSTISEEDLVLLSSYLRPGAINASRAMSIWLGKDVRVSLEELAQVDLESATQELGAADDIVCACCMRVSSGASGHLLLGFDDASGLRLCDMLLMRDTPSTEWGEIEMSAVMETANIVGCAFLNSLANLMTTAYTLVDTPQVASEAWLPTPPVFVRDFAAAIMQFLLMDEATNTDLVMIAKTQFSINDEPIGWRMIWIPSASILRDLIRVRT